MADFGIYLHWPFCQSKCPYCDFNSHVVAKVDESRWVSAYLAEIDRAFEMTGDNIVSSIYFGGGTPSLMHPSTVASILDGIRSRWRLANDLEITLEANPTSVEAARFQGYRDAGVNRVSIGVQALNDPDLRALGRLHSVSEAFSALEIANSTFDRVSFDLIYARQGQSLADWDAELKRAISIGSKHLSLYQLTVEDGTVFGDRLANGGLGGLPTEDLAADMYEMTQDLCNSAGLGAYEVSNHAAAGEFSKHNMIYWTGADYLGIGPGAHGRLTMDGTRFATKTPLAPQEWLHLVESTGIGTENPVRLSGTEQADEYLMMGLRISDGINLTRLRHYDKNAGNAHKIKYLEDLDMVTMLGDSLKTTAKGRAVLNSVIKELLVGN